MTQLATILIVDDLAANRETLHALLAAENYVLVDAEDGPSALAIAAEISPDLILLDVMMPHMDGYEVCRRLRAHPTLSEVPVIMITALSDQKSRMAGIEAGADDFVTKPFDRTELRARTRTIVRLNRYRRINEATTALRSSEDRYRALFDLGPVAIYSCDASGIINNVNKRAAELWGTAQSAGYVYGKFCGSYRIYGSDGTRIMHEDCPMALVVKGKIPFAKDEKIIIERRDGSRINAVVNIIPLKNARGEITGAINSFHDATEQKAAQEELRQLDERHRKMLMLSPDALFVQVEGLITFVNRAFCEMMGAPDPSHLIGKSALNIAHSDYHSLLLENWLDDRSNRSTKPSEMKFFRLDGSSVEVEVASATFEVRGQREFIVVARDITERKNAERTLRESEQWLRAVFEQGSVGVIQIDAKGAFARVNQRFCDIVGYVPDELVGISFRDITFGDDLEACLGNVARLRSGAVRGFDQEKRYVRKDGSIVWVSVAVSTIGLVAGANASMIAFVQDITGKKQLDEHFLQAQKMEALGQFSGGVAHDFNNILAVIGGYTELARMHLRENPDVREFLGSVLQATGRAADLVRQILTFSRHEPQVRQTMRLQVVVEESIKLMRATIPASIEFVTRVEADAPPVLANANQINQVLMNLGVNAWHAMKDRAGRLTVTLERFAVSAKFAEANPPLHAGDFMRISVGDTGSGMDATTLRRMFEPFFTTKPVGEGTGLGLSVVHGIMDTHDGAVTVQSCVGEGTVIRLYFPVTAVEAVGPAVNEGLPLRGNGEKILVVDDEDLLARVLQKALITLGYDVDFLTSPNEALNNIRSAPDQYDLIITDQSMPVMSGLALSEQLRKLRPELAIILMTGYSLSVTPERVRSAGVRQLVQKPITISALGAAVHSALTPQLAI